MHGVHKSSIILVFSAGISAILICVDGFPNPKGFNPYSYGIRLQPEIDNVDLDEYLKNSRAVQLQIKCLIHDGPCDWVGRWLKPRVAAAILGECKLCTEHQKKSLPKVMSFIQTNFPVEFRLGIKKYLLHLGINIPKTEDLSGGDLVSKNFTKNLGSRRTHLAWQNEVSSIKVTRRTEDSPETTSIPL